MKRTLLYLSMIAGSPSHERKLAGIRRYGSMRGPLMVVRRKSTSGSGRHEQYILEAIEIIRREACDGLTVADLLRRFPQSRRNFERRFREATGQFGETP